MPNMDNRYILNSQSQSRTSDNLQEMLESPKNDEDDFGYPASQRQSFVRFHHVTSEEPSMMLASAPDFCPSKFAQDGLQFRMPAQVLAPHHLVEQYLKDEVFSNRTSR